MSNTQSHIKAIFSVKCFLFPGIRRFLTDIETMIGKQVCGFMPYGICKYWWALCWCILTPAGLIVCIHGLVVVKFLICTGRSLNMSLSVFLLYFRYNKIYSTLL